MVVLYLIAKQIVVRNNTLNIIYKFKMSIIIPVHVLFNKASTTHFKQ